MHSSQRFVKELLDDIFSHTTYSSSSYSSSSYSNGSSNSCSIVQNNDIVKITLNGVTKRYRGSCISQNNDYIIIDGRCVTDRFGNLINEGELPEATSNFKKLAAFGLFAGAAVGGVVSGTALAVGAGAVAGAAAGAVSSKLGCCCSMSSSIVITSGNGINITM